MRIFLLTLIGAARLGAQQLCDSGAAFSPPLTITKGGTYTGNWQSTDPSIPAVAVRTTQPVIFSNSRFKGPGELISANAGANAGTTLTVQQSCFVGVNPNVAGVSKQSPIHVYNAASVLIQNCDFNGGGFYGVWIQLYAGDHSVNNTIRILRNRILNVDGRKSDGNGGYLTTDAGDKAHAIILSNANGVPGIEIGWNQIVNLPYQSRVEDSINLFDTSGTAANPVQVHDNYIQGGYAADPAQANALGYTGTAFTTDGDAQTDPTLTTAFVKIHDNQAVNVGNVGFGIALGHDNEMYNDRVVSSGRLADGTNISTMTGAGISHNNYRNNPAGVFGNNSVHDNLSGLLRMTNGNWERSDYNFHVAPAISFNNADWLPDTAASPTQTDEENELLLWNEKLIANGITVGSSQVAPAAPVITTNGVVNGANSASTVAPGSYVVIYGSNLAAAPAQASVTPLPTALSDVIVTVNGEPVPLYYVGPNQIDIQMPWDVLAASATSGTVNLSVTRSSLGSSQAASVKVAGVAPGILTSGNDAIAINADGTLAAVPGAIPGLTTHTAAVGDVLVVYATGLGAVTPALASGAVPGANVTRTVATPTVLIGGVQAQVLFSGLTPQFTGINQINVIVPAGVASGAVPLQIQMGGITTSTGVTVGIGPH